MRDGVIAEHAKPVEWLRSPGLVAYEAACALMAERVDSIAAGKARELVWLLEHPPLYTAGTSAKSEDLIEPGRFPVAGMALLVCRDRLCHQRLRRRIGETPQRQEGNAEQRQRADRRQPGDQETDRAEAQPGEQDSDDAGPAVDARTQVARDQAAGDHLQGHEDQAQEEELNADHLVVGREEILSEERQMMLMSVGLVLNVSQHAD